VLSGYHLGWPRARGSGNLHGRLSTMVMKTAIAIAAIWGSQAYEGQPGPSVPCVGVGQWASCRPEGSSALLDLAYKVIVRRSPW
jgi:hypothetical protein